MGWRVAHAYEDDRWAARRALPLRRRYAWLRIAALVGAAAAVGFAFVPEGRLACDDPWLSKRSPDTAWTLTVCRRPMFLSMPGGSGDAPGWIVLRDAAGSIRDVVHLDFMQLLAETGPAGGTIWNPYTVTLSRITRMRLSPASGPVDRWLVDRTWRIRAILGLVRSDDMSSR